MDLHYLEYILEIANMHSISKAAENLYITQSTLSQYLSRLEQELGVRLFERKRNEMILTPAGKLYVESCEQMLQQKKELYNQLSDLAQGKTGSFSLVITPQWGSVAYANIVSRFRQMYPHIEIQVKEEIAGPLIRDIQEGTLDMAIIPLADSSTLPENSELLQSEELIIAIPTSHAAHMTFTESGTGEHRFLQISAPELKNEPIIFSQKKTTIRKLQDEWFLKKHIKPKIIMEINSHPASLIMVEDSVGSTFVPFSCVKPSTRIVYAHAVPSVQWFVVIAFRKDFVMHSGEKYFISLIKEYFKNIQNKT